jgi:hypothetical protein
MLSCISPDQLQNSNPCVEVWHNPSFHLFPEKSEIMSTLLDVSGGQQELLFFLKRKFIHLN